MRFCDNFYMSKHDRELRKSGYSVGVLISTKKDGQKIMIGIYCILNTVNGKRYIGQSKNIFNRRMVHFSGLRRGDHINEHLQRAWFKYGKNFFEWHVLEEVPENILDIRECYWIEYYQSYDRNFGYNNESGGNLLHRHSKETCRKMSEAAMGNSNGVGHKHSEESLRKMSMAKMGHVVSEETRRKISESCRRIIRKPRIKILYDSIGRWCSKETRHKRSVAMMGHIVSEDTRRKISESKKQLSVESHRRLSESKMGHFVSDVSRRRMSRSHKNPSTEVRRRMSEAHKGKHPSEETRRKLSEAGKGRRHTEESLRKMSEKAKLREQRHREKRCLAGGST